VIESGVLDFDAGELRSGDMLTGLGVPEANIFYDKFTTTGEQEGEDS
jgi:hypothetical protein